MSDMNCNVIRDLLPLYIDGVVSDETKELVEEHLTNCRECSEELELLKKDIATEDVMTKNIGESMPILKIKKQIRKKQIIVAAVSALAVLVIALCGFRIYLSASRPDINGNEKIISRELADDGMPKDIVFNEGNGFEISRSMEKIFLSLPVNNKKMSSCKVAVSFEGIEIENKEMTVSEAGYVTYAFENLQDRKEGLYLFAFYDTKGEINQYVTVIITP